MINDQEIRIWSFLRDRWWKRLLIVALIPIWVPLGGLAMTMFFIAFVLWCLLMPLPAYVITGHWPDPSIDDWMRGIK